MSARKRESWAQRKDRLIRDAISALWTAIPVVPDFIKNQMEHQTPWGGKDGPQWADWFREGRMPTDVDELACALTVIIRAWKSQLAFDADMFRRSLAEKDVRIGELDHQLKLAEQRIAGLEATLKSPWLRLFATLRTAIDTFRQLWGDYRAKHGKFQVRLERCGPSKIQVIKALRELKQLGLKEAKDLADSAPCVVLEYGEDEEVQRYLRLLKEAGAETSTKLL